MSCYLVVLTKNETKGRESCDVVQRDVKLSIKKLLSWMVNSPSVIEHYKFSGCNNICTGSEPIKRRNILNDY